MASITLTQIRRANKWDVEAMQTIVDEWNADYSSVEAGEGPASISYHLVKYTNSYQMVCVHVGDCLENSYTWNQGFERCSGCGTIQINLEGEECNHCCKPNA